MTRTLTIIGILSLATVANAQTVGPVQASANLLPNYFNRTQQPLSPYLNLFNGANPGVNYYYGVRPGLPSGGQPLAGSRPNFAGSMYSPFSFQYTPMPADAGQQSPGQGYVLPPAGHVNSYGNFFGIAGSSLPGYGQTRGSANPGIVNTRANAPAPRSRGAGRQNP